MKNFLAVLLLAGSLGVLANPAPADAAVIDDCLNESIASCDSDFSGNTEQAAGIRGWCYMIRWGMCVWLD